MAGQVCPICAGDMESRHVAPCFDCGHDASELGDLSRGQHEYNVHTLLGVELVLCDFCSADFDSYQPAYLGFPEQSANSYPLRRVSALESPAVSTDLYCPTCGKRLAFLSALKAIRESAAA